MEFFLHPSILKTDCSTNIYEKDHFGSVSRSQIISAPAPQHCIITLRNSGDRYNTGN